MPDSPVRLAAIGDSLTQGFMSGAISKTASSVPALVARSLGLKLPMQFRVPNFPGFGLPLNLEELLRFCEARLGSDISGTRQWLLRFPALYQEFADSVEDLYERGAGSRPAPFGGSYHNLAVWGFRVFDSFTVTPRICKAAINDAEGWIKDDFLGLPSAPMYRTAMRVLNPRQLKARNDFTQLTAFKDLVDTEGLDALILSLGANDCLGTVLSLEIKDMAKASRVPADPVQRTKRWNLTSQAQFADDYQTMASQIAAILGDAPKNRRPKVFVATVPHVTIPPVTRGVGGFDGAYFDHYGRFFVTDGTFHPRFHSNLTRKQVQLIDSRIDAFNTVIRSVAQMQGWHLVDVCAALDKLAVRRNGFDAEPGRALVNYLAELGISDHPLLRLQPMPSILRLTTTEQGRRLGGGLFSLDCVHPTTIGYGIMADLFLREMRQAGIPGADPNALNWNELIQQDSLLNFAPGTWDDIVEVAQANPWLWDTLFSVLG